MTTIWGYVLLNSDDLDVVANTFNSLSRIPVDRIIAVDGGTEVALIHRQRNYEPIESWLKSRKEYDSIGCGSAGVMDETWNSVPFITIKHPWIAPGQQRNFILEWISSQPDRPDWIVALDSDEIESTEAETGMRQYIASLPDDVTNVVQPLLNLIQDERHCAGGYHSSWLSHSRLHRIGYARYSEGYHEHQNYSGKRVQWDARIIHTRMLFRKRLYVQRNAPSLRGAWKDLEMVNVPVGVSWSKIEWPADEFEIPFDESMEGRIE